MLLELLEFGCLSEVSRGPISHPLQDKNSAHGRIRTCDARFRKPTLYPLSYVGGTSA